MRVNNRGLMSSVEVNLVGWSRSHQTSMSSNGATPDMGSIVLSSPFSTLDSTLSKSISYTSVLHASSFSFKPVAKRFPLVELVKGWSSNSSEYGIQIRLNSFSTPF